jgi:hypothetical protein
LNQQVNKEFICHFNYRHHDHHPHHLRKGQP